MYSKDKAQSVCDVKVAVDKGSIRLSFPKRHSPLWELMDGKPLKGKPKYLYLGKAGFSADDPDDCKRAAQIAIAMEADLDHPEWDKLFDRTLEKYGLSGLLGGKYAKLADVLTMPGVTPLVEEITVGVMWEAYLEWKKTVIEETTFISLFSKTHTNALSGKVWNRTTHQHEQSSRSLINTRLDVKCDIVSILDEIKISHKTNLIFALCEAFDFCKSKGLLINSSTENPFIVDKYTAPAVTTQQKYASKIVNGEEKEWHEINEVQAELDRRAFTKVERDIIIKAFYESSKLGTKALAPLIEFYFLTGCRTSEALALTWKDVDFERNTIRFSKSLGKSTKKVKDTKTGEVRLFYFGASSRLKGLLIEIRTQSLGNLVFPNTKGHFQSAATVGWHWLTRSSTKTLKDGSEVKYYYPGVVTQLAEQGLIGGYLSPYHTRHTYITLTAHANAHNNNALLHIATACGNSVDVILRHYLGVSESVELTEV